MKKSTFLLFMVVATLFWSCNGSSDEYILKGNITGADGVAFQLYQVSFNIDRKLMAKAKADGSGNFKMNLGDDLESGIYNLEAIDDKNRNIIFVWDDNENVINLSGDYANFAIYGLEAKNAPIANKSIELNRDMTIGRLSEAEMLYMMDTVSNAMIGLEIGMMKFRTKTNLFDRIARLENKMKAQYPESDYTKSLSALIAQRNNTTAQAAPKEPEFNVKVGQVAPDIALPSPEGKTYKLSDLRGKVVLVDFWASWCGPCRRNNPHLVSVYNKYKDKGFTVYSVSLDRQGQEEKWAQAIEADKLTWPYHVSDLQFWNSAPAAVYGVRAIPATFLLDKDGKIVEINPRGNALEDSLDELL